MVRLFFENPQQAIPIISSLMQDQDWKTLASYYDMNDSKYSIQELESGRNFYREEPPNTIDPFGFWKYKHPFPPGFQFNSQRSLGDNLIEVLVSYKIDQGDGMINEVHQNFTMKKSNQGYQLILD